MLRVSKRARGAEAYYLAVAAETGTGIEPVGQWQGRGAELLGLHGPVSVPEALGAVLDGCRPDDGSRLAPAHHRVQVAAFDLTFCAPKSVSLLQALGDASVAATVQQCHLQAVGAAVDYVERCAAAVRPATAIGRVPTPVDGLVIAAFDHHVSRAGDPHLHSHLVVANLGRSAGGTWRALDGRGLYAHRAAVDVLYHQQLRHALAVRLGLAWEPPVHGRADIAGIGPDVRRAFSRRAAAIAEELARCGARSRRAREVVAAATRAPRDPEVGAAALRSQWRRRALDVGLTPQVLDRALGRRPARSGPALAVDGTTAARAAQWLVTGRRRVARRHAVTAVGWAQAEATSAAAVERAADDLVARLGVQLGRPVGDWRPGVAEPRLDLDGLVRAGAEDRALVARAGAEDRALLARHLATRGLEPPEAARRPGGRALDDELGFGLG
jgi:conjugative relaxase-like TrwC/TraI family protein